MTTIGRIDQAILVLKDRLKRLGEPASRGASGADGASGATGTADIASDPLLSLRQMVRQRKLSHEELRKALVRTLLAESVGEALASSLEFQSIADRVTAMLEQNDAGLDLINRALSELE